ncbi:MAG: hypothetical protein ACJ71S_07550 [Acidobacteriaceae bacterium]
MEPLSNAPLPTHDRRSFLGSLVTVGLSSKAFLFKSEKASETVYRILTPECEIRMSVECFGNSEINTLRFRDDLTQRRFCLTPDGVEDRDCAARFSGSMAIVHYHFRSHHHSPPPLNMRERVLTIDHHSHMDPRPSFERLLIVQREIASDIQAFGYKPDHPEQSASSAKPLPLWCLLRQDLFLNDQQTAFLIVHWKHSFDAITLLDVIAGDGTESVQRVD